jgi:disulfide bond formation protein DsbB
LAGCQAPSFAPGLSVDALLNALPSRPNKPCDAPTYLIEALPLSMAAMNLIFALALGGFGLMSARGGRP